MDNFMVSCSLPSSQSSKKSRRGSGQDNMAQCICLIDFGLVENFFDFSGGKHQEDMHLSAGMVGTPLYASCNVMEGHTPSQ